KDQMQNVRDDIAYMRAMAEEGRKAPLLGAAILISAGLIFSVASLLAWAGQTGVGGMTVEAANWGWLGAMALFFVVLSYFSHRMRGRPGMMAPVNRAAGTAWMGVGLAIFVMALSMAV